MIDAALGSLANRLSAFLAGRGLGGIRCTIGALPTATAPAPGDSVVLSVIKIDDSPAAMAARQVRTSTTPRVSAIVDLHVAVTASLTDYAGALAAISAVIAFTQDAPVMEWRAGSTLRVTRSSLSFAEMASIFGPAPAPWLVLKLQGLDISASG